MEIVLRFSMVECMCGLKNYFGPALEQKRLILHPASATHRATMDVTKMNAKLLTKELSQRGLATHDLTPALTERLEQTINNQPESISNDEFHALNKNATSDDGKIAEKEQRIAELKAGNKAELKAEEAELAEAKHHRAVTQRKLKDLEPRLSVSPKLPTSVLLSILGQLGKKAGERAACVKREWRDVVGTAKRWACTQPRSRGSSLFTYGAR